MFGQVPLQGEHYVRVDLLTADRFDVAQPSVLIFAPVRGTPTLVGAAYAFLHPVGAPPPQGFDGADDAWHTHERLSFVPGRELLMMHAWFVDAPAGPFARENPWLPYQAAGLTPPPASLLADSTQNDATRRLGLALALATQSPLLFQRLEARGGATVQDSAAAHRAAITALVPRLTDAARTRDDQAYRTAAAAAMRHADALVALYRTTAAPRPVLQRFVDRTVDQFMGRGHGIEDELGAMMPGPGSPHPDTHPGSHAGAHAAPDTTTPAPSPHPTHHQ
jgi:hypothetical protein